MSQAVGLFLFVFFLRSSCQKELKGVLPNIETKYTQCLLNLRVRLSRHCYKVLKEKFMILNKSRNLYFVTDCKIKNSSENVLLFIKKKILHKKSQGLSIVLFSAKDRLLAFLGNSALWQTNASYQVL